MAGCRALAPDFRRLASAMASSDTDTDGEGSGSPIGVLVVEVLAVVRARLAAGAAAARMDFEPTDALTDDESDRAEDPDASSGDADAGAAATAQPSPNATVQPAMRPAFVAVARVISTAIAPVPKVGALPYAGAYRRPHRRCAALGKPFVGCRR